MFNTLTNLLKRVYEHYKSINTSSYDYDVEKTEYVLHTVNGLNIIHENKQRAHQQRDT